MDGPSATDSILQNSAALHSLKKEQLVRLCKAHGVKANGKKSEMAERLAQLHATDEGGSGDGAKENMNPTAGEAGREIIHLGSIKEESASDFGSFKSSMSLKSLVSSFGFSRSTSTSLSSLAQTQSQADATVSSVASASSQVLPHQIPLPASPLIEPFTPPPNVEVGNTIRLVNIPRFSSSSFETSEPPSMSTPTTNDATSMDWRVGDTPMLAPFRTSFDLVVDGGVDTPARDVARMLRNDPGTPTRSNGAEGRFEFGTPRASAWAFRPSLSLPPPVPPLPERFRDGPKSDQEMQTATEDDLEQAPEEQAQAATGEEQKRKVVPRPSVTLRVMEEMMQRAELPVDPSRPVKPIPRRSLAATASPSSSTPTKQVSDRFDKAHEQLEARMPAINEPKGAALLKKRKMEEDTTDGDVTRKSARVGGRASGARPRASGVRPRQSSVRPRTSGMRRQSGVRPRVSGVRPQPTPAKKGLFGYVKGWFGVKPKPEPAAKKVEVKEKVAEKAEKKPDAPPPAVARKPSVGKGPITARKVTPTTGSMGPPKFVPKKTGTVAGGSTASRASITTASTRGSIGSTSKGSVSSTRGSLPATTKGSVSSATRGSINATTRGSITSTTRGSINSTTRGSVTSATRGGSIRGSITSTTRGSVTSTTRGSVTRGSLAPPSSSTPKSNLRRATAMPSMVPRRVTPTNSTSRLLQPTKSSLARASGPTATPKAGEKSAGDENTSTPLPTAPRIFREPLSETTFASSKIPTASGSKGVAAGNSSIASRSTSTRRPRISRTTVVARLAARRQVPTTPLASSSGSGSSATAVPKPPASVQPAPTYRKSAVGASGRRSLAVDRERKVRSSVGGGGVGKNAILGRRSVGPGPAARRR